MRALTLAAVIAATALHADDFGTRYEPVELWGTSVRTIPCQAPWVPRWSIAGPGNRIHIVDRQCDPAEVRYQEEQVARDLRYLLGDPGRH
jgi:hypothetical protein